MSSSPFNPALIVVDVQNDFVLPVCVPDFDLKPVTNRPQTGALSVPHGEDVIAPINQLLTLPFSLKIATKDWHPKDHVSFASNHPGAEAYSTMTTIKNPKNPAETYQTLLWPNHCVQMTPGASLHRGLDLRRIDKILEKGTIKELEMYSAFYPPLENPRVGDSGLAQLLRDNSITDVFCVGLAADYCVSSTAEDAAKEGFRSYIIDEATRPVMEEQWMKDKKNLGNVRKGVNLVHMEGPELKKVRDIVGEGVKVLHEVKNNGARGLDVSSLPTAK